MKQGQTKNFFQPTKAKVGFALLIALLWPISLAISISCFATHSSFVHTICNRIGVVFVFFAQLFSLPSLILSELNYSFYNDLPSLVELSLNALFTLTLSYLIVCTLADTIIRK